MIYNVVSSILALLALQANALPTFFQGKHVFDGQLSSERSHNVKTLPDPYAKTFDQRVDHFDRSNLATFSQRYFINDTFWQGPESNAPVFLCVGGEGTSRKPFS